MRRVVIVHILTLSCLLTGCSSLLNRYIPYEDQIYPEKADNAPKPAAPVAQLKIPTQLGQKKALRDDYHVTNHARALAKREDLLMPPNSHKTVG